MYFKDGSTYSTSTGLFEYKTVTRIGWLNANHPFVKGDIDSRAMENLWNFCKVFVNVARGFHECEFCQSPSIMIADRRYEQIHLGFAEIVVFGALGKIFVAPNLIYHYIENHQYLPPSYFIKALLTGPQPPSEEYIQLLKRNRFDYSEHLPIVALRRLLEKPHIAFAKTLEQYADETVFADISDLVFRYKNGLIRESLVRSLGKMLNPEARSILTELAKDEAVRDIALKCLMKLDQGDVAVEQDNRSVAIDQLIKVAHKKFEKTPADLNNAIEIGRLLKEKGDYSTASYWYEYAYEKGGRRDSSLKQTFEELQSIINSTDPSKES